MSDEYEFGIILDSARRGNAAETDAIAKMCMAHPYYLISSLAENEADVGPLMCETFRYVFLNLDVITQRVGLQNWVDTLAVRKCIEALSSRRSDLYAPLADAEIDSDLTLQDLEDERAPFNPVKYASLIPSINEGKKLVSGVMIIFLSESCLRCQPCSNIISRRRNRMRRRTLRAGAIRDLHSDPDRRRVCR